MKMVAVLGVVAVLGAVVESDRVYGDVIFPGERESTDECRRMQPLGECREDQGPKEPYHLQAVYLGSERGPGWWRYPNVLKWVRHKEHDARTIMDTHDSWAKWIWHDCGDGFVCLESGRFPNRYLYRTKTVFGHRVSYSAAPESEEWTRMKVFGNQTDSSGNFIVLVSERFLVNGDYDGLPVYLYTPPRCEGYKKVVDHSNRSPATVDYKYTYEQGVTSSEKISRSKTLSLSVIAEVVYSIASASIRGSFSGTWSNEKSTALEIIHQQESSVDIPPGKRLVIWQKVATYGPYEWRSGVQFVTCLTDLYT